MGDHASVKSNESVNSDEFDFVIDTPELNKTPTLDRIDGDLSQIEKSLKEVLDGREFAMDDNAKSNDVLLENEDISQDCTIFDGITYLGAAVINAPKSEAEIQRNIAILNEQSGDMRIKVSVSIPSSSDGAVVLYDATTNAVMSKYEICRISFYARGPVGSRHADCFAFTLSHGESRDAAIYQCHVFRCDIAEAVTIVSGCFSKAFHRTPMTGSFHSIDGGAAESRTLLYVLEVGMEVREEDGKGAFHAVYKDRNGFKLKQNVEKQLCITIRQVSDDGPRLMIERCFGVLVAAGRHVRHSDMQLLEMEDRSSGFSSADGNCAQIVALWDPTDNFEPLNRETPKDVKQFMTVAVDLVIKGIQEPVRFQIETQIKVFSQNERHFWYFNRKSLLQQFVLNLKEVIEADEIKYEVLTMETTGELDRNLLNLNLNLSSLIKSPSVEASLDAMTPRDEGDSDGDEPLLSGTGSVSKDCSVDLLESWADVLNRWKSTRQRPKQLASLVRTGIPEALRCEVWQRLAGVDEATDTMEKYRILIAKECPCENVIKRDIARTFPAHDFFKEAGGLGQDSLYRLIKAYAVYDTEVGYCQGLSFLAATLLLHMPEEQAFCVLVKLMYGYGLRDLYKDGFDSLYLRLYQLNRLMEEHLPALWQHFGDHNVETHMFASQWFLTLFTARFPLYFVFRIIDVFLLQGHDTLFQIALALLTLCKRDLLELDFEGILKYFRVLPKKCRTEEATKQLVKHACQIRVKKLKKYEEDFIALKEAANNVQEGGNLEHLQTIITNHEEEIAMLHQEIYQLKEMLKKEIGQAERDRSNNLAIIGDFQYIRRNLENQLSAVRSESNLLKAKISDCENCSAYLESTDRRNSNEAIASEEATNSRIRELEQELAQTKLARVEAECRNQDLIHQLRNSELNLATSRNNWPPWLSKTFTSIKEAANKKELPAFVYSTNFSAGPRPNDETD